MRGHATLSVARDRGPSRSSARLRRLQPGDSGPDGGGFFPQTLIEETWSISFLTSDAFAPDVLDVIAGGPDVTMLFTYEVTPSPATLAPLLAFGAMRRRR